VGEQGRDRHREPIDPGPAWFAMPDPAALPGSDFVAVGADLAPATLLAGYRAGLFAMPERGTLGWWSPDPRGVLSPRRVHVSRSLRRSLRHFEVSVDACFTEILALCADPAREHGWINREYAESYLRLHELGWAHSVEVWSQDRLAGGLFGVEVGGLFAAESKAHLVTDASKAAVVALADLLADDGRPRLIDVQWATEHLATLGAREVPRAVYLAALRTVLTSPPRFGGDLPAADPEARIRWRR
jgi:leucyl/phenylalanyl-tRNA---protein transferase